MNTRFSLVPYHELHIGHISIVEANWGVARNTGGKFVLHLHDLPYHVVGYAKTCPSMSTLVEHYLEDLEWLGLSPDEIMWSTRNAEAHWEANQKLVPQVSRYYGTNRAIYNLSVPVGSEIVYHPWLTFTSVVDDHAMEIGGFIRGADLLCQVQLYDYFCCALGWKPPHQQYLPTIRHEFVAPKISKSDAGDDSIRSLREAGYAPDDILRSLRQMRVDHTAAHSTEDGRVLPANNAQMIIPDGYLTAANVRPVEHNDFWKQEGYTSPLSGKPYEPEAKAHIKRMKARTKMGLRAKRKAAAEAANKTNQGDGK